MTLFAPSAPDTKQHPGHLLTRLYGVRMAKSLALKWTVVDKFKDYLYQQDFTVYTDNNPVTYVLTSAKLDATGHRWLASLAAFHFDIRYRVYPDPSTALSSNLLSCQYHCLWGLNPLISPQELISNYLHMVPA
jgi:hypothetical protein